MKLIVTSSKRFIIFLIFSFILIGAVGLLLPPYAQRFFYYPIQTDDGYTPDNDHLVFENITFKSSDGTSLHGWFVPTKGTNLSQKAATVIVIHGNAGNLTTHWPLVNWLPARGYNVFIFDYRGFGQSTGNPTPKGTFEDSQAAIEYIQQMHDIDTSKLLILGQSLGGNNAIAAVGAGDKTGICGMVIDSTFFSYSSIANEKIFGAGWLMDDRYSAERHIQALAPIPLLFIHGTADDVIPHHHTQKLYELATSPKQLIIILNGLHIMALTESTYQDQVIHFFETALSGCRQTTAISEIKNHKFYVDF